MHPAGFYLGGPEKNYVALRLDVSMKREAEEPFEPIYHEYVHFLTRRMMAQLPLWMVEGLAEFYGNTRIETDRVYVGAPSASNLRVLRETPPLPLSTLFAVNASSPYYHEENKASIFYAESWALTHYLITRDWREETHHVSEFMKLLGQSVEPEEAARRTFGDPARLQNELIQYIDRFSFTAARLPVPSKVDPKEFQAEPASDAESLTLRADFMAHDRRFQQAQAMLEEALKLDPKLAAAYESMGFIYSQQGKMEEAAKWYSQAVALNSQSYLTNYYYAVSLFKGKPDDASAAKAESSLRAAIKIAPDFAPAYVALASLLASRHEKLEEAHLLCVAAVTLEPGNVSYRLNAAQVLEVMGRADDAVRVAKLAVSLAKTPQEQSETSAALSNAEQFQEYQNKLEAFRKSQAEAGAVEACQTSPAERRDLVNQEGVGSGETSTGAAKPPRRDEAAPASTEPPTLRHRDEELPGGKPSPDPSLGGKAARPELLETRKAADGLVEDAKCSGRSTLEITLHTRAGVMQLYSDNYFEISFSALNFTPHGVLNPCTDIKGWHARIAYHPAKDQPSEGEIMAVGLTKD
jgi:tetratricopeptide (TPR) repeat protein